MGKFRNRDEYGRHEAERQEFVKETHEYLERLRIHFEREDWKLFDKARLGAEPIEHKGIFRCLCPRMQENRTNNSECLAS